MLMARTDPDRLKAHRGLSMFLVTKPRAAGHSFAFGQPEGGRMEGRAIDTLGYRGMHSFEVSFDGWRVPVDCLVGGDAGRGPGFLHADGELRQWPTTDCGSGDRCDASGRGLGRSRLGRTSHIARVVRSA